MRRLCLCTWNDRDRTWTIRTVLTDDTPPTAVVHEDVEGATKALGAAQAHEPSRTFALFWLEKGVGAPGAWLVPGWEAGDSFRPSVFVSG